MPEVAEETTLSTLAVEVFDVLKRRGPLCPSQISVELLTSLRLILEALDELAGMGLVEKRPDRDTIRKFEKEELPWGLRRIVKPRAG